MYVARFSYDLLPSNRFDRVGGASALPSAAG